MTQPLNFHSIEELGLFVRDRFLIYLRDECGDGNGEIEYCLTQPQFVAPFVFGSYNYHNEWAKDCDICLVLSASLITLFSKVFSERELSGWYYQGMPIDIKTCVFGDLDAIEIIEWKWATENDVSCYIPMRIKVSHNSMSFSSVQMAMDMELADKAFIRRSVSQKCSNSFVKAKKKLTVEKDYDRYSSLKSLFHSIRISTFAYQYGKKGKIEIDSCINLYKEICDDYENHTDEELLELIGDKYKKKYNERLRLFRLFYPK